MREFIISKTIQEICRAFSEQVVSTNIKEYARRNQTNIKLIKQQIYEGKLAEWGVKLYLQMQYGNNIEVSNPDMAIYTARKKSFNADLEVVLNREVIVDYNLAPRVEDEVILVHVKSQNLESLKKYGYSWVFQKTDPLVAKPYPNDYCVFCIVDSENSIVFVKHFDFAKNIVYNEMVLPQMRNTKIAIYLDKQGKENALY